MIVSQLMSRIVTTCRPSDSLSDAAGKMWDCDVGSLPVVDDEGHVMGMVTDRDACMAAFIQGRPLSAISVDSAMAHRVHTCRPTDPIERVEALMKTKQVRRVPVVDEQGRLAGVISTNDIARESARELGSQIHEVTPDAFVSTVAGIGEPRLTGAIDVAVS